MFWLWFGPFRWVCASNRKKDLKITDQIAIDVLKDYKKSFQRDKRTNARYRLIISAQKTN